MTTKLSAERLRELLHYDPETGVFVWLVGRSGVKKSRNSVAGGSDGQGYQRIKIDGVYYGAHRLAWLYVTGKFPNGVIDHIDGCRTDNRFANLRSVSRRINRENQRSASSSSKTGLLGVCAPNKSSKRYGAMIGTKGRRIMIGRFDTPELAHEAYVEKKRLLHEGCTL